MKIELLKTFLEVSRSLHFRIASENLFITQSAVSARIKLLEDDLGVLLFDRSNRNLKLTPEGHRLIKHANELILMWQKTKQDVGISAQHSMQLVVGAKSTIWDIVLQNWLQKIHLNIDEVSLLTNTYNAPELRKSLLNRVVDIGFLFEPTFVGEIISEKVATVPLHLVTTNPDYVYNQVQLQDFIMVDYGESIAAQYLREFPDTPEAKHFMSQPRIALNFILDAGGSAYLPRQITFEYLKSNQLFLVDDAPVFRRDIYANYLANNQKIEMIEQVLQLFPHVRT
ncbi:LysR family transcriptional regulator [Psychromonas sp. 14N.309.X.WAT.B.A12]|uniref:LysR family transcriptional regulator n=1 Tax=unclassified Psychromonas TaxID=2614957 RepID=UPI0025B27386|nr:LysR family transcriptional regulator [Psychromonas sp. 14N.309.X.WAT.B.A12]MDN2663422.1 LysR family transcriptional regulator [Psychromonas sp. 14N.309.X.WAT.B.A12]